jgi:hypothetical protein
VRSPERRRHARRLEWHPLDDGADAALNAASASQVDERAGCSLTPVNFPVRSRPPFPTGS